ncbi:MAG: hypothetical protein H0U74_01880 [Bradymonadaceae bacterium]|nr:hypothetical protein [Lujinxingiaceae bacterium]
MPISALVLTLSDDTARRERTLDALRRDARLELGELNGVHLPVVAETDSIPASTHLVREELLGVDGVVYVDVAWIDFSDVQY